MPSLYERVEFKKAIAPKSGDSCRWAVKVKKKKEE